MSIRLLLGRPLGYLKIFLIGFIRTLYIYIYFFQRALKASPAWAMSKPKKRCSGRGDRGFTVEGPRASGFEIGVLIIS